MTSMLTGISMLSIYAIIKAVILIFAGYILAKISSRAFTKTLIKFISIKQIKLIRRIIFYFIFILFAIAALQALGFKLSALLGAAGILTVALGFASQTSVSNIISGLFLIAEKPFIIGDTVKIDDTSGEVLSIDLLSTKIRTNDNTLVRLPNEILIKSTIINLTRYPVRRLDLPLTVAYKENLENIRTMLLSLADQNPLCLKEPKPAVNIMGFGESGIDLQFLLWTSTSNLIQLKNSIQEQIKKSFEENHIEMPFKQLSISTASLTEPFPVKLMENYK